MIKKLIIAFIILIVLSAVSIATAYVYMNKNINKQINISSPELITISKGMTISSLSHLLVKQKWIESKFWLKAYVKFKPEYTAIKKGTYLIEPGINTLELLTLLISGKEHHYTITFIEGTTFKEWLEVLAQNSHIEHNATSQSIEQIASLLKLTEINPEGLFFPDTYAFTVGTTELDILKRANKRMNTELTSLWDKRASNLPYETPYEALIMASIIEKESGKHSEQPIISSVFINRLNIKMRLQTDPTVIYGLGDRYKGDIKTKHLREKTLYNTYRINGLPPTPIAMPGILALKASMNPADTDFFYFVSNGDGQHVFSRTLKEHNKAVAAYLKAMKNK